MSYEEAEPRSPPGSSQQRLLPEILKLVVVDATFNMLGAPFLKEVLGLHEAQREIRLRPIPLIQYCYSAEKCAPEEDA